MNLKQHILKFLRNTSVKGIGRVVNSESLIIRALWFVGLILFMSLAVQQVVDLVGRYTSYTTIQTVTDRSWSAVSADNSGAFPNLMLCSTNPLTSYRKAFSENNLSTPSEFYDSLPAQEAGAGCNPCHDNDHISYLRTPTGYLQYVGVEDIAKITRDFEQFVLGCSLQIYTGTLLLRKPCKDLVTIKPLVNPYFFRCYLLEVIPSAVTSNVTGYNLLVFVDNSLAHPTSFYDAKAGYQQSGIRVSLVEPNRSTDLREISEFVDVGKLTHMKFSIAEKHRMEPPYGTCAGVNKDEMLAYSKALAMDIEHHKYSKDLCTKTCLVGEVWKLCRCLDVNMMDSTFPLHLVNLTLCGTYDPVNYTHVGRIDCLLNAHRKFDLQCYSNCEQPCYEVLYNTRLSQATWPTVSMHRRFLDEVLQDYPFLKGVYKQYLKSIGRKTDSGNETLKAKQHYDKETHMFIKDNFLMLDILMPGSEYQVIRDEVKTAFSDLLSSIGGTLNLWSGITVYLFIEIVEFVFYLLQDCLSGKKKAEDNVTMVQVAQANKPL